MKINFIQHLNSNIEIHKRLIALTTIITQTNLNSNIEIHKLKTEFKKDGFVYRFKF